MRASEFFKLGKTQPYLDFVDVRLDTDIEVFIDATDDNHDCQGQQGHPGRQ